MLYCLKCVENKASPESPVELLLGRPARGYVNSQQELLEVDCPVLVWVKCPGPIRGEHLVTWPVSANHSSPEDVCAELLRVAAREALAVDLNKHGRTQLPLGAVLHEALVPLLDGVLGQSQLSLRSRDPTSTNHSSPHRSGCWSSGTPRRPWRAAPCPPGSPSHT